MEIIDTNNFDIAKLKLNIPSRTSEGEFSKITYNNLPIIIQTPISTTKQGVLKSGRKLICDLMFKSVETEFLNWFEQLESAVQTILYNNSEKWFESKLELVDIESFFTAPVKIFKSGKYYLMRVKLKEPIKIFKERDSILDLTYSDITNESNIISILEINGIRYTNKDFQFDIEIKQIMVVSPNPFLENCFIKIKHTEPQIIETKLGSKIVKNFDIDNIVNNLITNEIKIDFEPDTTNDVSKIEDESQNNLKLNDLENEEKLELDPIKEIDFDIHLEPEKDDSDIQIKELNIEDLEIDSTPIKLTNEEEYKNIYLKAKLEAEEAKNKAIKAYLELEKIKEKYNIESSDDEK